MVPTTRPESQLNINLSGLNPITDPSSIPTTKSPFGGAKPSSALAGLSGARVGAGSPLHEQASRLFPKRTRELQSQTGLSPNIWGPPTSGTSTPLFEIPESPSQDGFPDLVPLTETGINSPATHAFHKSISTRFHVSGRDRVLLDFSELIKLWQCRAVVQASCGQYASASKPSRTFRAVWAERLWLKLGCQNTRRHLDQHKLCGGSHISPTAGIFQRWYVRFWCTNP
jgi:hypothetical protein